jgi:HSP20 family protein
MSYPVRPWRGRGMARFDPYGAFDAMQERFNRMFGDALTGYRGRTPMWHPDVDIDETDDGWAVEVRLPGVAPDEVSIELNDRELIIKSRHEESEETGPEEAAQYAEGQAGERPAGAGQVGEGAVGEGTAAQGTAAQGPAAERRGTSRSQRLMTFSYRLTIPSDVDLDKIDATMDHGLLTVNLPRSTGQTGRRIAVGSSGRAIEGEATEQPTVQRTDQPTVQQPATGEQPAPGQPAGGQST